MLYNDGATSVLGGVRKRIASVSVHTLIIPEEHLAADVVSFLFIMMTDDTDTCCAAEIVQENL